MIIRKGSVDMSIKLKHILLGLLIFSLLFVDYFLLVFGFKELFNFTLIDSLSILSSLIGFLSIISAAGVAIYVMNKNHKDADKREEKRRKDNDDIEMMRAQFRIRDVIKSSKTLKYFLIFDFNVDNSVLNPKIISDLKESTNNFNQQLKSNKEAKIYNTELYRELIDITSKMIDEVESFRRELFTNKYIKAENSSIYLENIIEIGKDYLQQKELFKSDDELRL